MKKAGSRCLVIIIDQNEWIWKIFREAKIKACSG